MDVTTEPSPHRTAGHHLAVRLLMVTVVGGAAAVFAVASRSHGTLTNYHLPWLMLVALFYAGEASMVNLQFRRGGNARPSYRLFGAYFAATVAGRARGIPARSRRAGSTVNPAL